MSNQKTFFLIAAIDDLNDFVGKTTAWLCFGMVLVTFAVVILRYTFNIGWVWLQESVSYMHALVFLLGIGYTLKHNGHVRVDIFYSSMGLKSKAIVDLLGCLFLLFPVIGFIAWVSWDFVASSWSILEGSPEAGGIPAVFILKTAIIAMAVLTFLQGFALALRSVFTLAGHHQPLADEEPFPEV